LGSIYTDHYQYVLRVCRRFFRQPEDAEDAAAEVFLKLYRVLHQRDETMPFRPWVSQVAGRHCIDKLRQRKCERSSSLEDIDIGGFTDHSALSPLSEILRKDEQRQIRKHLTRLPEKYKVPLVLLYYKRMSYSEIAGTLNTRLPAIRMIIFRAKDFLRRNLRREQSGEN
jgi:RNA polymerase sigma-70 factor (ECF subfamily)